MLSVYWSPQKRCETQRVKRPCQSAIEDRLGFSQLGGPLHIVHFGTAQYRNASPTVEPSFNLSFLRAPPGHFIGFDR
jgi:hypothetical protein